MAELHYREGERGIRQRQAEQQIERLLTLRHGKKDFFTWNMDGLLKTAEKTTRTLQMFLTLVAVISLVVGDWRDEYHAGVRDGTHA